MYDIKVTGDLEQQIVNFQNKMNNLHMILAQELVVELPKLMREKAGAMVQNYDDELPYDYVGIASDNNKAEIVTMSANSTTVTAFNSHPQATYIEFGTGRVGENFPHPIAGQMGYEYYVNSKYKRSGEKYGHFMDFWHHKKKRVVGMESMPFIYQSLQEVPIRSIVYVSSAIRKALGGL
jgi:hypothetical protein